MTYEVKGKQYIRRRRRRQRIAGEAGGVCVAAYERFGLRHN
jgi:hypothetical protein